MSQDQPKQFDVERSNQLYALQARAIRGRIEYLKMNFDRVAPAAKQSDLVNAGLVAYAIASRFLKPHDHWPGHEHEPVSDLVRDGWCLEWYFGYVKNLCEVAEAMRQAIKAESLTPRSQTTRVPYSPERLAEWLASDLGAEVDQRVKRLFSPELFDDGSGGLTDQKVDPIIGFWATEDYFGGRIGWPDASVYPGGGLKFDEVERWATECGITQPGELGRLLGLAEPVASSVPLELVRNDGRSDDNGERLETWDDLKNFRKNYKGSNWCQKQADVLRDEETRRDALPGAKSVREGLAEELGYKGSQRIGQVLKKFPARASQDRNAGESVSPSLSGVVSAWSGKKASR